MHKFLIHLSIYFCLTRFGISFSPSSEAGVQLRQWFKPPGYGVSARAQYKIQQDVTNIFYAVYTVHCDNNYNTEPTNCTPATI
jgi:hypothetical protein